MRNLHQILLQEYGVEVWCLFRDWERLRLRASDYKNHRIFTLRCIHKDLVPISIKLKTTIKSVKARQIIRKAEKDLLQTRVKAINSVLDNVTKLTEECRTQLASIISAQRLRECQGFIDKVSEIRFIKVRQRQLNKYNMLLNKKEGNITRAHAINLTNNLASQAGRQSGRQASSHLPPGEVSDPPSAGSQAGALLPSRVGSNSPPAIADLPPGEGSYSPSTGSSSQAIAHLPSGKGSNSTPAIAHLPPGEGSYSPSTGSSSQAIAHLPSGKGSNSPLAIAHLPPSKGSSSTPAIAHLPPGEGSNSPSAGSSSQAIAHLPLGEGSNSTPVIAHLPSGEGGNSPQAGHSNNQTRLGRQGLR